ncbi:DUF4145 domain-containing protein [Gilliamella apis]|uniref:DUF4145 domain-containing protein n=1 Tax=Gilliamella apis TaxID=1970738 RepID=UPI000A3533D4|nr:DUF4145 domain-containing protein [Gilliamella apis]OTQ54782.1 hypothetical protein B6D21_09645 [Gilliamella apis]
MTISLDNFTCPHCLKENAAIFKSSTFWQPIETYNLSLIFSCHACNKAFIFELDVDSSHYVSKMLENNISSIMKVNSNNNLYVKDSYIGNVLDIYPKHQELTVPNYLSDIVTRNFKQAKELFMLKYYDQAGMTARRVVDLATKELLPEHTGMLNSRIKQLLDIGVITQQLFDWVDIIKLGGNSANHDYDDFTENEAKQLLDFTEMFLMYAFTLPKMVQNKRQEDAID